VRSHIGSHEYLLDSKDILKARGRGLKPNLGNKLLNGKAGSNKKTTQKTLQHRRTLRNLKGNRKGKKSHSAAGNDTTPETKTEKRTGDKLKGRNWEGVCGK